MSRIGIGIKVVEVLGDTYYITKPILEKLIKKYGRSFIKVKGDLNKVPKNMSKFSMTKAMREKLANAAAAKGKSPSSKNQLSDLMKSMGGAGKTLKSGGTKKSQGRPRRSSTSKNKAPNVTTTVSKSGGSSKVTSGGKSGITKKGTLQAIGVGLGLSGAGILADVVGKKLMSPTVDKDGGSMPSSKGKKRLTVKSRSAATSSPPSRGKKRLQVKPKSAFKTFTITDASPNKISGDLTLDVPRSIGAAKNRGSKYFYDKNGIKKLAVTAEDLKTSGKSLREWANTFAPKKQSKKDTTALTRTVAAMNKAKS